MDEENSYICACNNTGYTGDSCEADIDECASNNPCSADSVCINLVPLYRCNCGAGFSGDHCEESKYDVSDF